MTDTCSKCGRQKGWNRIDECHTGTPPYDWNDPLCPKLKAAFKRGLHHGAEDAIEYEEANCDSKFTAMDWTEFRAEIADRCK